MSTHIYANIFIILLEKHFPPKMLASNLPKNGIHFYLADGVHGVSIVVSFFDEGRGGGKVRGQFSSFLATTLLRDCTNGRMKSSRNKCLSIVVGDVIRRSNGSYFKAWSENRKNKNNEGI